MRIAVKAIAVGFLILSALIIGLTMYTQTDGFRAWLRERTVTTLREVVHGDVALEKISGDIWTGVTFHKLSFRDATGEVVQIPQATVTLDLLSQIRLALETSTFRIDGVTIQSPTLRLVQKPGGIWNIKELFAPSSETPSSNPLRLFIDHIRITDGHITAEPQGSKAVQIQNVRADGQFSYVGDTIALDLTQLSFRAEYPRFPPLTWEGGVAYKEVDAVADFSVKTATVRTEQSQIQLSGTVQNLDAPHLDLTTSLAPLSATELRSLLPESPLQQDLSGTVQMSGPWQKPTLKANLQAADGKATATADADLQQSPPYYEATVDLDHVTIHKVARVPHVQGEVSGRVDFTGTDLDSGKVTFTLQPTKLVVQECAIGDGALSGTVVNRRITSTGKTRGQIGQVQWNGWVELGSPLTYEGTIAVRDGVVANITKEALSVGETLINADVQIAGHGTTLSEIVANARVTLLPSYIDKFTDVHGTAVATFQQERLTLEQLTVTANGTTVQLQGQVKDLSQQAPQTTLSYNIQAQDIAPWLTLAGQEGQGAARLTGNIIGPLHQLTVTGTGNGNALRIGKNTMQNGNVTYRLHSVGQADAHGDVIASLQQLDAGGTWRKATVEATITRLQPLTIQTTLHAEGDQIRDLRARAHLQQQTNQWNVSLSDLTAQLPIGVWTQAQPASFTLSAGQIAVDRLVVQRGSHAITVSGKLAEQGPQDLQIQVTQLPLSDLQTLIPSFPPIAGDLSATLQLTGTRTQPEARAQLATGPLTIRGRTYAGLTGNSIYQNDKLTLSASLRQDAAHALTMNGVIPVSLSWQEGRPTPHVGDVDLQFRSDDINIALLGLVTTNEVEDLEGIIQIDLALRGPFSALQPSGSVQLRDGHARLTTMDVSLKDIGAQIAIAPEFLHLRQFTVSSGKGEVTGTGRIALRQSTLGDMVLTFVAKDFRVANSRRYKAAISGELTCSGSLQAPVVRGSLTFRDTTLRPNIALLKSGPPPHDPTIIVVQTEAGEIQPHQEEQLLEELNGKPALPPTPDLLRQLVVDVGVRIPRDTWIHMAEGSIEITGKLQVKKNATEEPRMLGSLETVRGWYAFHARKFNIERGQVTFPGTLPTDPNIDIVARYTVAPYDVDVLLNGTARTPTLELRSNPMLEEADILSVLIFGKPAGSLSGSEQVSLQTQAIQATAGYVASGLRQSIASKLGLDNLEFDMGQSIGQGRVRVGKYLIKDVYVSTSQQLGEKQEREVSVEYQIDRQWQLKGSTTSRGTSGVDVLWQKRY